MNQVASKAPQAHVVAVYSVFFVMAFAMHHFVANGEFSSILTMAVIFQCLAIALLAMQVLSTGSASGISARALALEATALCCRLSSTTWLNGYLPVDASGDLVFQLVDAFSLLLVAWLLHRVFVVERRTYDEAADSFPVLPMVLAAAVLAAVLHADMNSRPVFDTLWMAGLFIGVTAVLPQLWLIGKTGGVTQALTGHHIAVMAVSRLCSGTFMWHARFDITCQVWVEGYNHAIWAILAAHLLHLLLLGDFAYYYVKAIATQGLGGSIDLGAGLDVV